VDCAIVVDDKDAPIFMGIHPIVRFFSYAN